MSAPIQSAQSRRQFFKDGIRLALLGGALALGEALGVRKGAQTQCQSPCARCSEFLACELPKAQSARKLP